MRTTLLALIGWMLLNVSAAVAAPTQAQYDRFFEALGAVESCNRDTVADGDSGRAIGRYQIWKSYFADSRVTGSYEQCRNGDYARQVVEAYLKRYAAKAWASGDWESLARCHNSGPRWAQKKAATQAYWNKVAKEMGRVII